MTFSNDFRQDGSDGAKQILCTQRDLLTGFDFFLLEGRRGRPNHWVSYLEIDLQALISERQRRVSRNCLEKESNHANPLGRQDANSPEWQDTTRRASQVVAYHIIGIRNLLRKHEKNKGIPDAELTELRKQSDERLQNIFDDKFSHVGLLQRSEMIIKAERSAYGNLTVLK
jgi:hypothetical protein